MFHIISLLFQVSFVIGFFVRDRRELKMVFLVGDFFASFLNPNDPDPAIGFG
jgi:hypothetical protein